MKRTFCFVYNCITTCGSTDYNEMDLWMTESFLFGHLRFGFECPWYTWSFTQEGVVGAKHHFTARLTLRSFVLTLTFWTDVWLCWIISYHLNAAVFFKGGGHVSHHLLSYNLHCLILQMVFPDKLLAGQNCCSSAIWCRAVETKGHSGVKQRSVTLLH